MNVFLSPHNDDETLFGAFTLQAHRPRVIVCFRSRKQEEMPSHVTHVERERETGDALEALGCPDWEQWWHFDTHFSAPDLLAQLYRLKLEHHIDRIWAPAVEPNGHEQHNILGNLALQVFGGQVEGYLTYTRDRGRSTHGREVPYTPAMVEAKLRAMACYRSQMREPSCLPWFLTPDLREWYS